MKNLRRILGSLLVLLGFVILVIIGMTRPLCAQPRGFEPPAAAVADESRGIWKRNILGGHLGPWFAQDFGKDIEEAGLDFRGSETGFHLELFYQPNVLGVMYADLNIGAISRGQIRRTRSQSSGEFFFGDVTLYPVGMGVMIAPLAQKTELRFQPMFRAGVSLLILSQRGETTIFNQRDVFIDIDTHTEFGWYAGVGGAYVLGRSVILVGGAKYQFAEFDTDLLAGGNYSGVQILFGAAYLYR
ncbi:MAG TPA: hypothetical protein VLB27_04740 [candidate division Zixibacteria bacterium]|nr:hypothetical protein [candidate division Zixibacteria bacterium]